MIFHLIHSPLVGSTTWDGVGDYLMSWGHEVTAPSLSPGISASESFHETFVELACIDAPEEAWVVGHSGAGQLLPDVAERMHANGLVYVDAGLPHPGRPRLEDLPDDLATMLQEVTDESGEIPPWPSWFPREVLEDLIPDEVTLSRFVSDCPVLKMAIFTEVIPEFEWRDLPSVYLQLSAGYQRHAAHAGRLGWRVSSIDGHHLWPLDHPGEVARALVELVQ